MRTIQGDLLALAQQGEFDVIVHGCNCFNAMDAGIAKSIKHQFPAAYHADLATKMGAREKLGTYSSATIDCGGGRMLTIVNAYTQFDWRAASESTGAAVVNADYPAIKAVFTRIATDFAGQRIGYPLIGAGLAGGDWSVIAPIIDHALQGLNHTLVRYRFV